MRINNVASGRPALIDRSGTVVGSFGWNNNDVAPHAPTTRASYTVPTGRVAQVTDLSLSLMVTTVRTTAGKTDMQVFVFSSDAADMRCMIWNVTLGERNDKSWGNNMFLQAGANIRYLTEDLAVGGGVTYSGEGHIIEASA